MNLLIVDDDDICNFINNRVALTSRIFSNVSAVHNGQDALRYLEDALNGVAHMPDVILLDLNMPLLNGFEFIRALRSLSLPHVRNIHIIILTSSEDPNDVHQATLMGVDHYLLKPLTVNQLRETIFSLHKRSAA